MDDIQRKAYSQWGTKQSGIFYIYFYIFFKRGKRKQKNADTVIKRFYFMPGFFYMFIVYNLLLESPLMLTQRLG